MPPNKATNKKWLKVSKKQCVKEKSWRFKSQLKAQLFQKLFLIHPLFSQRSPLKLVPFLRFKTKHQKGFVLFRLSKSFSDHSSYSELHERMHQLQQ